MADAAEERAGQVIQAAQRVMATLAAIGISLGVRDEHLPWWGGLVIGLVLAAAMVASFVVILNQERWRP